MSLEAEFFGLTGLASQALNQDFAWEITWPGVFVQNRFVAVSFLPFGRGAKLERISEWFSEDENNTNPIVGEMIRATGGLTNFRFAVVVFGNN
jgi:hypothetical protein